MKNVIIITLAGIIFLSFSTKESSRSFSEMKALALIENLEHEEHVFGIDFSHYSGEVVWDSLSHKEKDISFIFLRATYGIDVDFRYCSNIEEALCREYLVGSYHYFRPNECGDVQAQNYLNTISHSDQHFLPVLDIERIHSDVTSKELRKELQVWLSLVENELCVKPIIYSNLKFWKTYIRDFPEFDAYPLWIAAYSVDKRKKEVMEFAHIYQFSDREKVTGIPKKVDGNFITKEKFLTLLR